VCRSLWGSHHCTTPGAGFPWREAPDAESAGYNWLRGYDGSEPCTKNFQATLLDKNSNSGAKKAESNKDCNLGIAVGSTGSALVVTSQCPFGPQLIIPPGGPLLTFGCFYSYTVVITALCCDFDLIKGRSDCR
jgi:hypothetical protein